jgi:hypothetical protein
MLIMLTVLVLDMELRVREAEAPRKCQDAENGQEIGLRHNVQLACAGCMVLPLADNARVQVKVKSIIAAP